MSDERARDADRKARELETELLALKQQARISSGLRFLSDEDQRVQTSQIFQKEQILLQKEQQLLQREEQLRQKDLTIEPTYVTCMNLAVDKAVKAALRGTLHVEPATTPVAPSYVVPVVTAQTNFVPDSTTNTTAYLALDKKTTLKDNTTGTVTSDNLRQDEYTPLFTADYNSIKSNAEPDTEVSELTLVFRGRSNSEVQGGGQPVKIKSYETKPNKLQTGFLKQFDKSSLLIGGGIPGAHPSDLLALVKSKHDLSATESSSEFFPLVGTSSNVVSRKGTPDNGVDSDWSDSDNGNDNNLKKGADFDIPPPTIVTNMVARLSSPTVKPKPIFSLSKINESGQSELCVALNNEVKSFTEPLSTNIDPCEIQAIYAETSVNIPEPLVRAPSLTAQFQRPKVQKKRLPTRRSLDTANLNDQRPTTIHVPVRVLPPRSDDDEESSEEWEPTPETESDTERTDIEGKQGALVPKESALRGVMYDTPGDTSRSFQQEETSKETLSFSIVTSMALPSLPTVVTIPPSVATKPSAPAIATKPSAPAITTKPSAPVIATKPSAPAIAAKPAAKPPTVEFVSRLNMPDDEIPPTAVKPTSSAKPTKPATKLTAAKPPTVEFVSRLEMPDDEIPPIFVTTANISKNAAKTSSPTKPVVSTVILEKAGEKNSVIEKTDHISPTVSALSVTAVDDDDDIFGLLSKAKKKPPTNTTMVKKPTVKKVASLFDEYDDTDPW